LKRSQVATQTGTDFNQTQRGGKSDEAIQLRGGGGGGGGGGGVGGGGGWGGGWEGGWGGGGGGGGGAMWPSENTQGEVDLSRRSKLEKSHPVEPGGMVGDIKEEWEGPKNGDKKSIHDGMPSTKGLLRKVLERRHKKPTMCLP